MLHSWSGTKGQAFRERFAGFINSQVVTCDCDVDASGAPRPLPTTLSKASLGHTAVFEYRSAGTHIARRTGNHVEREGTNDVLLYLPITCTYVVRQAGREVVVTPGSAAFVSLSRPLEGVFMGQRGELALGLNVRLPMPPLRLRLPRVDDCLVSSLPMDGGAARIMATLMTSAMDEANHLDETSSSLIGSALLDAVVAFAHEARPDSSRALGVLVRDANRRRVETFILEHLTLPELTPAYVARHCRVSLRHLHQLFTGSGWTLANWIKEQRLQASRQDLRHPALKHRSVSEVAYAWGFKDASHFSRIYRSRFGIAPSRDRGETDGQASAQSADDR